MTPQSASEAGGERPPVEGKWPQVTPLTEERQQELRGYWEGVLSGKRQPDLLAFPPEVEEHVRQEERKFPGPISRKARLRLLTEYTLSSNFPGEEVFYLPGPNGVVVLAHGVAETIYFRKVIPEREALRVEYTRAGYWPQQVYYA